MDCATLCHQGKTLWVGGGAYKKVIEVVLQNNANALAKDWDAQTAAFYAEGDARDLMQTAVQEQEKLLHDIA